MLRLSQMLCLSAVMAISGFCGNSLRAENKFSRASVMNGGRFNSTVTEKKTIRLTYSAPKWQWHTFQNLPSANAFLEAVQTYPGVQAHVAAGPNNTYYVNYRCQSGMMEYGGEYARTYATRDHKFLVGLRMEVHVVFLK